MISRVAGPLLEVRAPLRFAPFGERSFTWVGGMGKRQLARVDYASLSHTALG